MKRLTRKKAIQLCIELWKWCAKTGGEKCEWPGWEKHGFAPNDCWFCAYATQFFASSCNPCPLITSHVVPGIENCFDTFYDKWRNAKTPRTRKKYAKLFLKQIRKTVR